MLVLSRKPKESIVINGNITVSVLRVDNDNVRIGIEAPKTVPVMRKEIYQEISQNNLAAAGSNIDKLKKKQLLHNGTDFSGVRRVSYCNSLLSVLLGKSRRS